VRIIPLRVVLIKLWINFPISPKFLLNWGLKVSELRKALPKVIPD